MKGFHLTIVFVLTAITCSFVWVRLQIVSISYDIHELEQKERTLKEDISALQYRINQAKAPAKLEYLARSRFHMQPQTPSQTIILTEKN